MAETTKKLAQLHEKGNADALIYAKARVEGVEFSDGTTLDAKIPLLENKIEVIKKGNDALVIQEGKTIVLPDFYSKTEADAKFLTEHQDISGKANAADVYTKTEADAKFLTQHQDISGKANAADVYTKQEIDGKLTAAMHYKGTVATVAALDDISNPAQGDVYNVTATGANYAYDGSAWDKLSENIDLSGKQDNLTVEQLAAANSGVTAAKVSGYDAHIADNDIHVTSAQKTAWTGKQDALTSDQLAAANSGVTAAKVNTYDGYASTIANKANAADVYTKTAADNKFATQDEVDGLEYLGYTVIKTLS